MKLAPIFLISAVAAGSVFAADWPEFMGPTRDQVSRVLEQMARIASEVAKGDEPVVDYVAMPDSTLHISDPFFAYFLRWCTEMPEPS